MLEDVYTYVLILLLGNMLVQSMPRFSFHGGHKGSTYYIVKRGHFIESGRFIDRERVIS